MSSANVVGHDIDAVLAKGGEAPNDEVCDAPEKGEKDFQAPESIHEVSPRFIEADIRVIQRSTVPKCVQSYLTGIDVPVLYASKKFRAHKKLWGEVGGFLSQLMRNPPASDWRTAFYAAQILRRMGQPYQEKAYQFFLDELERLTKVQRVTDDQRMEAVELIDQFYFDYPDGPYEGLYKKEKHEPPVALFRAVSDKLDLLVFWPLLIEKIYAKHAYQGNVRERFAEYKRLVEGT